MHKMQKLPFARDCGGATLIELAVVLPIFLLIALSVLQLGLIFHAKNTLNHATLLAARSGAVSGLNQFTIRNGLAKGLAPLLVTQSDAFGFRDALNRAHAEILGFSNISILNPTREAFLDFGYPDITGALNIPFERLHMQSAQPGAMSGVNIQDANLLKLQVVYGFPLVIPLAGPMIATMANLYTTDPISQDYLSVGRLPIIATSVVRMQSAARNNRWVLSRNQVAERLRNSQQAALANFSRP